MVVRRQVSFMKSDSGSPLFPETAHEVNEWLFRISQSLPEFRDRPGQREMIELVRQVFCRARPSDVQDESGRSLLAIEGPTGTGKTLAYLLPGIIMARHLEKRLVVSSVTVGLQEQLASKDIPFLEEHSGWPLTHGIAKGRSRYVCERDLALFVDGGLMAPPGAKDFLQKMEKALGSTWDGDRDTWPGVMDERVFSLVANRAESCSGPHCQYYEDCLYFRNRKLLESVDIVVTNHDLLLADALLGGGVVLPAPGSSLLVVDEAHHLPEKRQKLFYQGSIWSLPLNFSQKFPWQWRMVFRSWGQKRSDPTLWPVRRLLFTCPPSCQVWLIIWKKIGRLSSRKSTGKITHRGFFLEEASSRYGDFPEAFYRRVWKRIFRLPMNIL